MVEPHDPVFLSIDLSLVAWTVLDTLHFKFLFDVFGDTPLHGDCIHATHIFIYHRILASGGPSSPKKMTVERKCKEGMTKGKTEKENALVRCHRDTQLFSGSVTAMLPSKCVVVHA